MKLATYAEVMATDFGASLVRFDVRDLSEKNAEIVRAGKRSIDHTFRGYITEGISDRSIKPCDAKLAAFAIAGSLNWIAHWYRENKSMSGAEIADAFITVFDNGLQPRRGARS